MIQPPRFASDLLYSVQNEDARTELAVLERLGGRRRRALLVASSGENALGLLCSPQADVVDAVDLSAAQIHLCELRWRSVEVLARDEQLELLGADPGQAGAAGAPRRVALYERLRVHLSAEALAFWDARRDAELAFGAQHVGRNDRCMQDLVAALRRAGISPLDSPADAIDAAAWEGVYRAVLTPAYLQGRFGFPSAAIAARLAALAPELAAAHLWALRQPGAERNPFVTTVFRASYAQAAGEEGLPLYLQRAAQERLRQLGIEGRLRLHIGNVIERLPALAAQHGPYDLISLSNIADWMDSAQLRAVVGQVIGCLRPGGALLARAANPAAPIRAVIADEMGVDPGLDAALPGVERGPWFRTIAVGFRKG